ncbi:MAG: RrF2 family transcriptional regulator [Clostridia bacterium]|nr:RrF2 family transcriptional regulator [Clostridia bacterium]
MMISTKGRYALHVMIDLAQRASEGPVPLSDISQRHEISMKYLEMIVSMLNKAGFVESYRGKSGGYRLTRDPGDYTMQEILELTEGTLAPVSCIENGCPKSAGCVTVKLWRNLDKLIEDYLKSVTLKDLVEDTVKVPGGYNK